YDLVSGLLEKGRRIGCSIGEDEVAETRREELHAHARTLKRASVVASAAEDRAVPVRTEREELPTLGRVRVQLACPVLFGAVQGDRTVLLAVGGRLGQKRAGRPPVEVTLNLVASVLVRRAVCREHLMPGRLGELIPQKCEQEMLGADEVVSERCRLPERELQRLLRVRGERRLAGRRFGVPPDELLDLESRRRDVQPEQSQDARGEAVLLEQQAEQKVLGADVVVSQLAGLVLREDDRVPCPLGESAEDPGLPASRA